MSRSPQERFFSVIDQIVKHDQETHHFWNNTGHLCHDCIGLIGKYRQTILDIDEDKLVSQGYSWHQALQISDYRQDYLDIIQQRLSD